MRTEVNWGESATSQIKPNETSGQHQNLVRAMKVPGPQGDSLTLQTTRVRVSTIHG